MLPNRPQKVHHRRDLAPCALTAWQRMKILPNNKTAFIHSSSQKPNQEEVVYQFIGRHKYVDHVGFRNNFVDVLTENAHGNLLNKFTQPHFLI